MTRPIELTGTCNRCGSCCAIDGFRCQYLLVSGEVGHQEATACRVYDQRYQGMPILLWKGVQMQVGHCSKDSQEEREAIVRYGFGHGCSLIQIGAKP